MKHYILAEINDEQDDNIRVGNQISIGGVVEFATLEDAEKAMASVADQLPSNVAPVCIPPCKRYFVILDEPR